MQVKCFFLRRRATLNAKSARRTLEMQVKYSFNVPFKILCCTFGHETEEGQLDQECYLNFVMLNPMNCHEQHCSTSRIDAPWQLLARRVGVRSFSGILSLPLLVSGLGHRLAAVRMPSGVLMLTVCIFSESLFISRLSISCPRVSESFDVNIFHFTSESFLRESFL